METKKELRNKVKYLEGRNALLEEFVNEIVEKVPEAREFLDEKMTKTKELLELMKLAPVREYDLGTEVLSYEGDKE